MIHNAVTPNTPPVKPQQKFSMDSKVENGNATQQLEKLTQSQNTQMLGGDKARIILEDAFNDMNLSFTALDEPTKIHCRRIWNKAAKNYGMESEGGAGAERVTKSPLTGGKKRERTILPRVLAHDLMKKTIIPSVRQKNHDRRILRLAALDAERVRVDAERVRVVDEGQTLDNAFFRALAPTEFEDIRGDIDDDENDVE